VSRIAREAECVPDLVSKDDALKRRVIEPEFESSVGPIDEDR
jgi:hypothetical protein